jgi:hypothetical protein
VLAHRERDDRDRRDLLPGLGDDARGGREVGADVLRRLVERDLDLEVDARSVVWPPPCWAASLALLPILVTRPTNAVSGNASIEIDTESPRASRTTSVSSTSTFARITPRSATVMSRPVSRENVPGTATSPSSTARRVTRPEIGA